MVSRMTNLHPLFGDALPTRQVRPSLEAQWLENRRLLVALGWLTGELAATVPCAREPRDWLVRVEWTRRVSVEVVNRLERLLAELIREGTDPTALGARTVKEVVEAGEPLVASRLLAEHGILPRLGMVGVRGIRGWSVALCEPVR
jgi:hypothetical protein